MRTRYSCTSGHYAEHVTLHQLWTAAVGTAGYDKKAWMDREEHLHRRCKGGCLRNPPPLDE